MSQREEIDTLRNGILKLTEEKSKFEAESLTKNETIKMLKEHASTWIDLANTKKKRSD